MNLFGWQLRSPFIKAAAPLMPPRGQDRDTNLAIIQPPFGTNPPTRPLSGASYDLGDRAIRNDPRELWYLALPNKLPPKMVLQLLRSALGGDLWQQWQLESLMLDSWPMFRKCAHELRQAVSTTTFTVRAYAEEGQEPTARALEKQGTVQRALRNLRPDKASDEKGFSDTVYDLAGMVLSGLVMTEVMWWDRNGEYLPRAFAWVHPRHFTFGNNGRLAVFDQMYNRLNWALADLPGTDLSDESLMHKFLVGQFMSRSGSPLGAGLMRPLAWDWSAVVYNREWMLQFAQRYGTPFLDAAYDPGMTGEEIAQLNSFIANAGPNGYIAHTNKATLNVHAAQSLGANNPQELLKQQADEHCMLLLLGQTASTAGTPGKLGGEQQHMTVRQEHVQGLAAQVARVLTEQLARSVIQLNYGEDSEVPTIDPDFSSEESPQEKASRWSVFLSSGVPLSAEEFYEENGLHMPQAGELVIQAGQMGEFADPADLVIGAPPPEPDPTVDEFGNPIEEDPSMEDGETETNDEEEDPAQAKRAVRKTFKDAVKRCSDKELAELRELLVQAKAAGKVNGEIERVRLKVKSINSRRLQL